MEAEEPRVVQQQQEADSDRNRAKKIPELPE
jgi:hypothetical protein